MTAFDDLVRVCRETPPSVGFVLGSGMGDVSGRVAPLLRVPFAEVPELPAATVVGHRGCFTLGDWAGRRVLLQEGRLHFYEGHSWDLVVRPVRTMAGLGVRRLVLTNAAGGIADALAPGSLMILRDQIDAQRPHWYRESPQASPYAPELRRRLRLTGPDVAEGVYLAVTGPSYETPAEIRAMRCCGADAVGMSTVREARAAVEAGMETAAVSVIANRAAGLSAGRGGVTPPLLSHHDVLTVVAAAAGRLADLLERFISVLE
jgi:purine-nucleoside phosphorylase